MKDDKPPSVPQIPVTEAWPSDSLHRQSRRYRISESGRNIQLLATNYARLIPSREPTWKGFPWTRKTKARRLFDTTGNLPSCDKAHRSEAAYLFLRISRVHHSHDIHAIGYTRNALQRARQLSCPSGHRAPYANVIAESELCGIRMRNRSIPDKLALIQSTAEPAFSTVVVFNPMRQFGSRHQRFDLKMNGRTLLLAANLPKEKHAMEHELPLP